MATGDGPDAFFGRRAGKAVLVFVTLHVANAITAVWTLFARYMLNAGLPAAQRRDRDERGAQSFAAR